MNSAPLPVASTCCFPSSKNVSGGLDSALIASIGVLDSNLLLVLRCARLVPDELWAALEKVA